MLKELIIRFLLVAAPSCAVLWAFAYISGELRTSAGLTNQVTMTATLLGVTAALFGGIFLIATLIGRLSPNPARVEPQPLEAPATSASAPAMTEAPKLAEPRLMSGAQQ